MLCDVMEEQEMEITLEKETKGEKEKMLSYLSTSFSQPSQKKREEDVQMSTTTINVSRQNNPQGLSHTLNINFTSTTNNSKSGEPCSSNSIRSCPNSSSAPTQTNSTYCVPLDNDISGTQATLPQNTTYFHINSLPCTSQGSSISKTTTTSQNIKDKDNVMSLSLLELAWEDILFSHLFLYLSLKDLFHLRATSSKSKDMIDHFFSKIKNIDLSTYSSTFTLEAFQVISSNSSNLRKIVIPHCKCANDSELTKIFKNNQRLSHVDLTGCLSLTGSCLLPLAVYCKLLKTLKLSQCNWLSIGAVHTIISHLKQIEEIDFSSCSVLGNDQLIPFSEAFPGLKKLYLGHIKSVNDSTLVAFSRNCVNLETLDIRACMSVTDNGIRSVGEYCVRLKELYVAQCHLVSEYSLNVLRRRSDLVIDRPANPNRLAIQWPIPRLQV